MDLKARLRNEMKAKLKALSSEQHRTWSCEIANHLTQSEYWKNANTIGITISRYPEVDTEPIIRQAWAEGKRIVVPKCNPSEKSMTFRTLNSFDELEVVYFGLKEPIESITEPIDKQSIDLLVVPGLVYSQEGYRIGFGGGYYDRFLIDYPKVSLSLAFRIQMTSHLPKETHDLPVEFIITNEGIVDCRG